MNLNDCNNGSSNRSRGLDIQYFQDSYASFSDQTHTIQQHKPKSTNRKLQRYRRKLPKQQMSSTAISCPTVRRQATTRTDTTTTKKPDCRHAHVSEPNRDTTVESSKDILYSNTPSTDYTNVPDQVFSQMLARAFHGTDKLHHFPNEKGQISFLRHYIALIDRLSYVKLQLQQWEYYYHLGMTQGIWIERISKYLADRNSISYTYGRSKTMIQQRLRIFQAQLEGAQNSIQLYENRIVLQVRRQMNYSSEMKALFLIITAFVTEHQQKLRDEFEYKRQLLILDAADHHFLRKVFDSNPNRSQIASARRIWQATMKQTALEEQGAMMERRRTARIVIPSSTLFDRVLVDIDTQLAESMDVIEPTTLPSFIYSEPQKLNELKRNIIHRSVQSGCAMIGDYARIIHREKQNFFVKTNADQHTVRMHVAVLDAIEHCRLHMVKRASYITQQKLISYFKQQYS